MVGAILLAAGAGRRMGGPKALLVENGVTFLERGVGVCQAGGCDPIWVVVRPDVVELERLAGSLAVRVVTNEEPERGMFSSVQAALKDALSDDLIGFVVQPVDHPHVREDTVRLVADRVDPSAWVVPRYGGRSGHPIGIGIEIARRISGLPDAFTLREALEHAGAVRVEVDVDDPGVLQNVNTR